MVTIGRLKRLQSLSFMGSSITCLTKEIGHLSELRWLDLNNCRQLRKIEPDALRSLVCLEELQIVNSFKDWEADEVVEPSNAKLDELNTLSELSTLFIHVLDTAMLPKDLPVSQLDNFIILIGDCWDWSGCNQNGSRTLKLKADSRSILLERLMKTTLDRTEDVHLDGLLKGSLKKSIHQLSVGGFHGVKQLHVQNSPLIHYMVQSAQGTHPLPSFMKLETLSLESLDNLEQICHGPPPKLPETFNEFKFLKITNCGKLKNLFCISMVIFGLKKLEEIEIRDCEVLKEIVQDVDGTVEDRNNFDGINPFDLRRLKLHNLPNFTAFCYTKVEADGHQINTRSSSIMITSDTDSIDSTFTLFDCQQISFKLR